MITKIFKNKAEFLKREDKKINGVSQGFADKNPRFKSDNETNKGCWNCSGCHDCYGCYDCYDCYGKKESFEALKVKDLNKKILSATSADGALEMSDWHTCETTHCWAGWIVFLAGDKGKELEEKTSTLFAAMMIFKESNGYSISPCNFFLGNEGAMLKIKEFANKQQ